MKTFVVLSILQFGFILHAQKTDEEIKLPKAYEDLINYAPNSLKKDTIYQPDSQYLRTNINTIGLLDNYISQSEEFKLSERDLKWLYERVDKLSAAFYHDGKRVLMSIVGGYGGCSYKMLDTIYLNDIEIINLKLCSSCVPSTSKKFTEVFNDRMFLLTKIHPPDDNTKNFYGKYEGYDDKEIIELILNEDRTFKYWVRKNHSSDFSQGFWENSGDTLILNSKNLNKEETISFSLSNATWMDLKDTKFRMKNNKLINLKHRRRRLKKVN